MSQNFLYGLTVQGIQSYIFATNKLKEIIGASEIIEQLCTTWFEDFLTDNKFKGIRHLNAAGNIRFQTDDATAVSIFENFHFILLEKAPGVPFSQAVVEIKGGNEYQAIQELDKKLRGQRNKPLFQTDLGTMTRRKAQRTGDFAFNNIHYSKTDSEFLDVVTNRKYKSKGGNSLSNKSEIDDYTITYPSEFSELAKNSKHSWLALVHIDGNGMGKTIKAILETEDEKFESLKKFSDKVGEATLTAFKTAIKEVVISQIEYENKKIGSELELPMRPIIIGGDDVTLIIRADLALEFTRIYLEAFETATKVPIINGGLGLTACAGIAYVKEKFPFHYSAHLAEELCVFAKKESSRYYSCVQFHRVQDSIIDNYEEIIARELTTDLNLEFQNGPYYIGEARTKTIDKKGGSKEVSISRINDLVETIKNLKEEDSPTNGMREWIDASFNNPNMADTLMKRLESKLNGYNEVLKNKKAFIDYQTLLAVNTKTD